MNSVEIKARAAELRQQYTNIVATADAEIRSLSEEEQEKTEKIKEELKELHDELKNLGRSLEGADEEKEDEPNEGQEENNDDKINQRMSKNFRLLSAIADVANNRTLSNETRAVVENGAEEMRQAGLSFGGQIQIPVSEARAAITVADEHDDMVSVEVMDVLEPLRAKNVLVEAGAKLMTNLNGDVVVPVMSQSNVTWEGETAAAKDGAGTFNSVKLQPKRLTAYVDVSKQFLLQTSDSAERVIREDIINAINSKLEATILGNASGTTTQPAGIFYSSSALTSANTYAKLVDLEATIEDANVMGECKYIMSNKAKAVYRSTAKGATTGGFVLENGEIDGTKVLSTSHVPAKCVAYGDFSNVIIGQWGAIDLTVDPYTRAANGEVRLVVNAYFDAKVARPEAIAIAQA